MAAGRPAVAAMVEEETRALSPPAEGEVALPAYTYKSRRYPWLDGLAVFGGIVGEAADSSHPSQNRAHPASGNYAEV